ncbi:MAG TPA: hypothetical protein VGX25_02550 [Actinophytocola sp.]|uniref:hypothetical protein n=1 Tax=Actinophytocola sp. TaxID=1872138 RepID=UPI002DDD6F51|nr:hypothetical protein [Actinophytocola sp.]HEV2778257.1 hypothetical protein [Actinophytocola sp.]
MFSGDVQVLVAAASELVITPRRKRWAHLSLCVLDAVFSINARYGGVVRVCHRHAEHAGLTEPLLPVADVDQVVGTGRKEPVIRFVELGHQLGPEHLAGQVLRNRGRTSARGGILKADAAIQYAQILATAAIRRLGDVAALLVSPDTLTEVEAALRTVPGHGRGAHLSYLWMLAGDDQHVKPDRMVLRWLTHHLGRDVDVPEARTLLTQIANHLGHTPWELDHAIWRHQSGRS